MKKILITGSEGNVGTELQKVFIENGHPILRCDIIHKYDKNYIMCDITNLSDLYNLKFSPDVVVHMAAKVSRIDCEKSPCLTVSTNLSGLMNVIQLCMNNKAKLIYFSTSEVYGNIGGVLSEDREDLKPNNLYGLTKYQGEQLVKYYVVNYGLKAVIVRPFMIYNHEQESGEDKCALNRIIYTILNNKKFTVHKKSTRSWINIKDFCDVLYKILDINNFEIINIGHPEIIQTTILAKKICNQLNVRYENYITEIDLPSKMTLRKEPSLVKQSELLNFYPKINIDEGIKLLIDKAK